MHPLLDIKNLHIDFLQDGITTPAVQGLSFQVNRGKLTAIVGESGSGKSVTALSILQLLPGQAVTRGELLFSPAGQEPLKLSKLSSSAIRKLRGKQVSMIFQEPMTSLNPVLTCGSQVMESLMNHLRMSRQQARKETIRLFEEVELPDPATMVDRYPHQLSGGQKQRVMIAMAMSCQPDLLVADEPTTALDVRVQKNILTLLKKLQQQHDMAVLLITHDLNLVTDVADEVIVMYQGRIVEQGVARVVLEAPQHPYTRALLACRPAATSKGKKLTVLKDILEPGGPVEINSGQQEQKSSAPGHNLREPLLVVKDLEVHFPAKRNFFGKPTSFYKAVDGVSLTVMAGETVGLVGESGCGKTTLGRSILRLVKPTAGTILLKGNDISRITTAASRQLAKELQIVFQDPYGSLNPRISIGKAILEPLQVHRLHANNKVRMEVVMETLSKVQLSPDHFNRYPHQFSGGQRQRICIARALVMEPSFLVFDESVSALDVSVQASILNLINELKTLYGFTSIFISHDLSVVHYISDRILVMNNGKIIEEGTADQVYFNPQMDYTRALIDAIPGKRPA